MKKLKEIWHNRWVRFSLVALIYLLWFVIWTRSWVMLLGVLVIYDLYITKHIDRLFLDKYRTCKKEHAGFRKTMEWVEALLYAMVFVLPLKMYFFGMYVIPSSSMERSLMTGDYIFVNKVTYGPKMPNTPLSFPFVHNTMPFSKTARSYVEWVKWPHKRLAGTGRVERNDVVIFNFPEGDTVALGVMRVRDYDGTLFEQDVSTLSYYDLIRAYGRNEVYAQTKVLPRPVDKRENYIKRCVGVPGDSIQIIAGQLYVNGEKAQEIPGLQYSYGVITGERNSTFENFAENTLKEQTIYEPRNKWYRLPLTQENLKQVQSLSQVQEVIQYKNWTPTEAIFPHDPIQYPWTEDYFGPLWIPKKGVTVPLNANNLPLYERIIKNYEGNELEVRTGETSEETVIYINGEVATEYTFAMDYYFMMGDNRHYSADSRYWGFVPEDHIEGKGGFIWLSIEPGKNLFNGIRWNRMFKKIE